VIGGARLLEVGCPSGHPANTVKAQNRYRNLNISINFSAMNRLKQHDLLT